MISNLSLAIAGVLLALIIAEAGLRLVVPPYARFELVSREAKSVVAGERRVIEQSNGEIERLIDWSGDQGVRLYPNVRGVIKNHRLSGQDVLIETNGVGLRDGPLTAKAADEVRILLLGDSIIFGDYVPASETIPELLSR